MSSLTGKKLAVILPGIGYSNDKPLLYYSRKALERNGYEVVRIEYTGIVLDKEIELDKEEFVTNGAPANRKSKDKLLEFVANAKEVTKSQLEGIDFANYSKIVFVSKGIGSVVGAICAKQQNISPYHVMITPIDYAFQFAKGENVSIFCGTNDLVVNYTGIQRICKEESWGFHSFNGCNNSLETGNVDIDITHLQRYLSVLEEIVADIEQSIYDIEILGRNQHVESMSKYKDKVLLIVNTATGCGFTPQYQMLEELYKRYNARGFEILDFPCNQFANQAPGTESEIYSFCTSRYDISFEQYAKVCVNGEKQSQLFEFLKSRKGFKGFDMSKPDSKYLIHKLEKEAPDYETTSDIKWNFTKFLVNRKGQVIERFEPTTDLGLVEEAIKQLI